MTEIGLDGNEYSSSLEYLYNSWLGPITSILPIKQRITELTFRGSELEKKNGGQKITWTIPIPTRMGLNGQTTLENGYLNWDYKRVGGLS